MTLSKREKVLILLLLLIGTCVAYYFFVVSPQMSALKNARADVSNAQNELLLTQIKLSSLSQLEDMAIDVLDRSVLVRDKFLRSINQDEIIMMVNALVEASYLNVDSLNFQRSVLEEIEGAQYESMAVNIPYSGDFFSIIDFLEMLREYDKQIIVQSISATLGDNNRLTGSISMNLYGIPGDWTSDDRELLWSVGFLSTENPFVSNNTANDIRTEYEITIVVGDSRVLLEDFESVQYSVLSRPSGNYVSKSLDQNSKEGSYSLRLDYSMPRNQSSKSISVLLGEGLRLLNPPKSMGLWVYSNYVSGDSISLFGRTYQGEEIEIIASNAVDWSGWNYLEFVPLISNDVYPIKLEKLQIDMGTSQNKTGYYLIDGLFSIYETQEKDSPRLEISGGFMLYEIKEGDTLEDISVRFYGDLSKVDTIIRYNNIRYSDISNGSIRPGRIILLPKTDQGGSP